MFSSYLPKSALFIASVYFNIDMLPPNPNDHAIHTPPSVIRVVSGGYEAIDAIRDNKPIAGPRTESVKTFLQNRNVKFNIETMLWSRAYNLTENTPDVLIYPLTRIKAREDNFTWLHKVDEHRFHLLAHKSINPNQLSMEEIVSGKYYAVCETNTSNCQVLLDFGFKEKNIFRVSGIDVEKVVQLLADGRANFMMENYSIVKNIINRTPSMKGKIEQVKNVEIVMEDYLAASKLSPNLQKTLNHQ